MASLIILFYSPLPVESDIMSFVRARLPNSKDMVIIGFPSQEDMVDGLLNITRLPLPGCFAGGAGTVHTYILAPITFLCYKLYAS